MLHLRKNEGFTLLELIVVIAIMSLFFGISLANYNSFTSEKKFDAEIKKFIDILELAKSKSRAGDVGAFSCSEFDGYKIAFSGNQYFLRMCCDNACTSFNTISTYTLPSNTTVSVTGASDVQFFPLTFMTNSSGTITATFRNSLMGKCIPVTISPNALIEQGTKYAC